MAIGIVTAKIDELVAQKIDPIKIPAEGGDINLRKSLDHIIAERDAALAKFDAASRSSEGSYVAQQLKLAA